MKILGTKSNLPLSPIICWGLNEDISHFAFEFDGKFVIHSSLKGVEIAWASTFRKKNKIVYEIDMPLSLEQEESVYRSIMDNFDAEKYDYRAFIYFAWRALLYRLFKTKFPSRNAWNSRGFLCTEMAKVVPWEIIAPKLAYIKVMDLSIISPSKLIQLIVKSKN